MKTGKKMAQEWGMFALDDRQWALPLETIERIVRAVEITPLPHSLPFVKGLIDVHGEIIPVLDLRRRLGLPEKEMSLSDQLILVKTPVRTWALWVDETKGLVKGEENMLVAGESVLPRMEFVQGILKNESGLILILDLNKLISLEEEKRVEEMVKVA